MAKGKFSGVKMSISVNEVMSMSTTECMRLYRNYHCEGNSLNISPEAMGYIGVKYDNLLPSWQSSMGDENEYLFDDSDYKDFYQQGRELAKESSGHSGSTAGQTTRNIGGTINQAANVSASVLGGGLSTLNGALGNITGGNGLWAGLGSGNSGQVTSYATTGTTTGVNGGLKASAADWCAYASAIIVAATAAAYHIKKPNEDGKEACDILQNEMANAQACLNDSQAEMAMIADDISCLQEEAFAVQEEANDVIVDAKTEYDFYATAYEALLIKAQSGQPLSKSEQMFFDTCCAFMSNNGMVINETTEDAGYLVGDIYGDMETYQEGYDYTAETMAEVQGVTDFAAQIDDATQKGCYTANISQNINFATGMVTGARLLATSAGAWWNAAVGAATIAAGLVSKGAAAEQKNWAGQVGQEIQMRQGAEEMNTMTNEVYLEGIDLYAGSLDTVASLEVDVPDDIAPPTQTTLPTSATKEPEKEDKPKKEDDK